ncbi:MAG: hypothetical protein R3247_02580 [Rhodothermales bacterium]|nr:hypothetical protein [Rhodothermales bacterium]
MRRKPETLDLDDIQGLILRGYGGLPAAHYLILHIADPVRARHGLRGLLPRITDGYSDDARRQAVHVAFTYSGLERLGLNTKTLRSFPRPFREGMARRNLLLGDCGASAPERWRWGGPQDKEVHALLLLFAREPDLTHPAAPHPTDDPNASLAELAERGKQDLIHAVRHRLQDSGLEVLEALDTRTLIERKEHFGFHDGIAQPMLHARRLTGKRHVHEDNLVAPGEFILGYRNEYGRLPDSPTVSAVHDPLGLLPRRSDGRHDLGRNGSYLVFRQLRQDVHAFWRFVDECAARDGAADPAARDRLAAKMVGRWPSGAPLVLAPDADDPALGGRDDFGYHDADPYGERCPIAAHVRRTNPRDVMQPGPARYAVPGKKDSTRQAKRHRLLRRGRAYGDPLHPAMTPDAFLRAGDDGAERGLHFLCLNANLTRQFEFVQHTWINNTKFGGLYDAADPIVGTHDPHGEGRLGIFCAPDAPVRQRLCDVPTFVTMRGGAYFFLPGIRALRYLAAGLP